MKCKISKVISGGQTGVDQAGLRAAKNVGIETGGYIPLGFLTEDGFNLELGTLYGLIETVDRTYPPRTEMNVRESDATLRIAYDFNSSGERCTLRALRKHSKPFADIKVGELPPIGDVVKWLVSRNIKVLNIAGNKESSYPGIGEIAEEYLTKVFKSMMEQ